MRSVRAGDEVYVTTADGVKLLRIAVSGPVDGDDFRVVWVCKPDDWPVAADAISYDVAMAWPVEYVSIR